MNNLVFSHIALSCSNPLLLEEFYTKFFGFKRGRVIPLGDGSQIVFLTNAQNVHLELFQAEGERPFPKDTSNDGPHYPAIRHIAFQVSDVESIIAQMGDAAEITLGPLDFSDFIPGWKTTWIKDPEGNIVEISQGYTDSIEHS